LSDAKIAASEIPMGSPQRGRQVEVECNQRFSTNILPYLNKKLIYRRGTARRSMLVSSYYVSRGIAVRKVSLSKGDLQGHSRALAMVPFDRRHMISY